MQSHNSLNDFNLETQQEHSISGASTPIFSEHAQSQTQLTTWESTVNSPTMVPSPKKGTVRMSQSSGKNWQHPCQKTNSSKKPAKRNYPSSMQDTSGMLHKVHNTPSPRKRNTVWTGNVQSYMNSPSIKKEPQLWWDQLDVVKHPGRPGLHRNLLCGCVILTCSEHLRKDFTKVSYLTKCPSNICQEKHRSY